jgi:hypothetical protein
MTELDYRVAIEALENHVAQTRPIYETAKAIDYLKKSHQEALAKQEHGSPEDMYIEMHKHLNCPHCGGSGHIDDVKQEQGEPVAWMRKDEFKAMTDVEKQAWMLADDYWKEVVKDYTIPLYTTPQPAQKPWVGLTDEEIQECLQGLPTQTIDVYARRIEAKLKEKNSV